MPRNRRNPVEQVRFPAGPLLALCGGSVAHLAEAAGVARGCVYRWQTRGLTLWRADATACALGLHPTALWPEFCTAIPLDDDARIAA